MHENQPRFQSLEEIWRSPRKFLVSFSTKLGERILQSRLRPIRTIKSPVSVLQYTGSQCRWASAAEHVPVREIVDWDIQGIPVCHVILSIVGE